MAHRFEGLAEQAPSYAPTKHSHFCLDAPGFKTSVQKPVATNQIREEGTMIHGAERILGWKLATSAFLQAAGFLWALGLSQNQTGMALCRTPRCLPHPPLLTPHPIRHHKPSLEGKVCGIGLTEGKIFIGRASSNGVVVGADSGMWGLLSVTLTLRGTGERMVYSRTAWALYSRKALSQH